MSKKGCDIRDVLLGAGKLWEGLRANATPASVAG